jgi:drug/metabolite transporter (DMT)-like permease
VSTPLPRAKVVLALLVLYLVWGSTYLGIRVALAGFPPLFMAGARYLLAGGFLYALLRLRGAPRPSAREWVGALVVGTLLVGGNALVSVSEQWVGSGLAAVVIASMPLWAVLLAGFWGEWPSRREWIGLAVGLAGVGLLQGGGELRASPLGAALLVVSTWSWALGSMWSRRLPLPTGPMASAAEMLGGGAAWLAVGLARGDRLAGVPALRPLLAFAYLTVFGSLVAFSAYAFLLRRVRPALATSYAYVNPVVAVGLGALAGEPVGGRAVGALALILSGVGIVAARRASAAGAGEPS